MVYTFKRGFLLGGTNSFHQVSQKQKNKRLPKTSKTRYSTLNARGNFCKPQSLLEAGLNKNTIYIKYTYL